MNYINVLLKAGRLFLAVPMFGLATGALFPIVALRLESLGSDSAFIGLVTTMYYCGSFCAAMLYGIVLSKIGYRAGFVFSALLAAVTTYALTLTENQTIWLFLRFVGGFSLGAYYVVVDGWFQAIADRHSRGKVFAAYETVRLAATAAGPFLLVLGSVNGSLLIVGCAYLTSILPILFTKEPHETIRNIYRFAGLADMARCFSKPIIVAFCGGVANASFYGLSALYAIGIGLSVESVAFFVAFVLVAPAISEIPLGALADRFTRMGVASGCALVAVGACLILIAVQSPPLWLACIGAAVVGAAMVPMYAFGLSRIVDATNDSAHVEATSTGLLAYNAGAFIGPVLAGSAMMVFGPVGLYIFLALVAMTAALAAIADTAFTRCCPEGARA